MVSEDIVKLERLYQRISTKTFIGMHYIYLDTCEAIKILKRIQPGHLEKFDGETAEQYNTAVKTFYESNWTSSQVAQLASKYRPRQEHYDKFNKQQQTVSTLLSEIIELLKQLTTVGETS